MAIKCTHDSEFFSWLGTKAFSTEHTERLKVYYKKHFNNRNYSSPIELYNYIQSKEVDINNITKCVRVYLNFCEAFNKLPLELISKYRSVLKLRKYNNDYFVPSDEDIIKGYCAVKSNESLELVYLVLATSGIRYGEAIQFLTNYDSTRFIVNSNYASYNVSDLRHTKNINNIYLPLFVYKKLKHLSNTKKALRQRFNERKVSFSFKYLRKWQYNFLIYNSVPEGVADFIQGRANKSIGSTHYLAKRQQADFWYSKITTKLSHLFSNAKMSKKICAVSRDTDKSVPSQNRDYSEVEK